MAEYIDLTETREIMSLTRFPCYKRKPLRGGSPENQFRCGADTLDFTFNSLDPVTSRLIHLRISMFMIRKSYVQLGVKSP